MPPLCPSAHGLVVGERHDRLPQERQQTQVEAFQALQQNCSMRSWIASIKATTAASPERSTARISSRGKDGNFRKADVHRTGLDFVPRKYQPLHALGRKTNRQALTGLIWQLAGLDAAAITENEHARANLIHQVGTVKEPNTVNRLFLVPSKAHHGGPE